jgi:hypothetical protein
MQNAHCQASLWAVRHRRRHHCASRIMVHASVVRGAETAMFTRIRCRRTRTGGSDYPFTTLSFTHRVFYESPASYCNDSSQNVSNLRSGVIESLRAVHDDPAYVNRRRLGIRRFLVSTQEFPLPCLKSPGLLQKFPISLSQGIFTNPLKHNLF